MSGGEAKAGVPAWIIIGGSDSSADSCGAVGAVWHASGTDSRIRLPTWDWGHLGSGLGGEHLPDRAGSDSTGSGPTQNLHYQNQIFIFKFISNQRHLSKPFAHVSQIQGRSFVASFVVWNYRYRKYGTCRKPRLKRRPLMPVSNGPAVFSANNSLFTAVTRD